jgi:hypothetical protein
VESKIEYEVGQRYVHSKKYIKVLIMTSFISVSVYAPKKGRKGVDENDLWYGIIKCLKVDKRPKALQVSSGVVDT